MNSKIVLTGLAGIALATAQVYSQDVEKQPNIILIMVDDMGYSDLGCFGSEIPTPNIDRLAQNGVKYTQFYNTGRSCPTRASLLTGLYPHQTGIGGMAEDPNSNKNNDAPKADGYVGYLNKNCVTMGEVLKSGGYDTYMVGKWHVGMHGQQKWPLQRGFDRFYGILAGATSYFRPQGGRGITLDNEKQPPPEGDYYTTDAFTDHAIEFMRGSTNKPFFLYVAYNAPHWPLHAKQVDIDRFAGKYDGGWDQVWQARHKRMIESGIVDSNWALAEWESRSWSELTPEQMRASAMRMEVYAAQIYCVDYNVGRIVEYLEQSGQRDNTLIVFLSDNGACAEPYSETGFGTIDDINDPNSWVAPSYGLPWAQVSNTPFRKYKVRAYEGGISTPLILSWTGKFSEHNGALRKTTGHIVDIMATFVDASGTPYPTTFHGGSAIHPMEGVSLLPSVVVPKIESDRYIYGEHFNNCSVRHGDFKAVKDEKGTEWELYNIEKDRSETINIAAKYPKLTKKLVAKWNEWAHSHNVFPKVVPTGTPVLPSTRD